MSHSEPYRPPETPAPSKSAPDDPRPAARNQPLAIIWAVAVALLGGYVCGLAISQFGTLGSASLWALGVLAGFAGRKILTAPSRPIAWTLAVACVPALVIAEVCWIHWNTRQGAASWWIALMLFPTFLTEYKLDAAIAAVFTLFGALAAFRQTAYRYRLVAVVEE